MFINTKILKSLMTEAYKTGLTVGETEDSIYIGGNAWEAEIMKRYLPKQVLGELIKLIGMLPGPGKYKKYIKTRDGGLEEDAEERKIGEENGELAEITSLVLFNKYGTPNRILTDARGQLVLVNNVFIEITNSDMNDENEVAIQGPYFDGFRLTWETNEATLRVAKKTDEPHERLIQELSMVDLSEDE